ncbi:MAG: dihydrolipoamide acetyltransferase family protein [Pseudomonadota bacterium]
MGIFAIRLPDVGEGVAEAELVELHVAVGDQVREDDVLAAVMTDKATVEIPSSVSGKVTWIGGQIGETVAVGSDLIRLEVAGPGNMDDAPVETDEAFVPPKQETPSPNPEPAQEAAPTPEPSPAAPPPKQQPPLRPAGERPLAVPSVRKRAREEGFDLSQIKGTGGAGQITHADLEAFMSGVAATSTGGGGPDLSVTEIKVAGLRRKIAERMSAANSQAPHITIVEEVDVSTLEELRAQLNREATDKEAKLTVLPFLMGAIVRAVRDQPALNANYDAEAGLIRQYGAVHIGIATQVDAGLMVPVIRHTETLGLRQAARELSRVAQAARDGTATREELTGSTITITSLGKLGAIATTPILNLPEVAIIGVNRIAMRPVWNGTEFTPRQMMNLSCSFDHRVIDGWDAAVFVQRLKTLLETPAMIFIEG